MQNNRQSQLARWRSAVLQGTTFLGVAMIGLVWAGAVTFLGSAYENARHDAIEISGKLARAIEENIVRSMKETDAALLFLRAAYQRNAGDFAISDWVGGNNYRSDLALQLSVVGADGIIKQISVLGPDGFVERSRSASAAPVSVGDREHFQFHARNDKDGLFISKPVVGKTTGKVSILLTRRIYGADRSFGGIVAAALDPFYFSRFYESVDLGKDGSIALIGADGFIRAHAGYKENRVGLSVLNTQPFRLMQQAPSGYFISRGGLDGITRTVSYRKIDQFPFFVIVGLGEGEVYAEYRRLQRNYYAGAAGLTLVLVIVIGLGIGRAWHLNRARAAANRQNLLFDAALNNMSHGLCMFDADGKLVVHNARYLEMFSLPPECIRPGVTINEIVGYFAQTGSFLGNIDKYTADVDASLAAGQIFQAERHMKDGRIILVTNRPLSGGGWVATHEDISVQRAYEKSLREALNASEQAITEAKSSTLKLDAALGNMLQGLIMMDAAERIVVVNEQYIRMYGLSSEVVKPGCTLIELFEYRAATGHLTKSPEAYRAEVLDLVASGKTENTMAYMADGRQIAIVNQPMPDGGWVATHEDVTERKQSEARIAHMAHYDALTESYGQKLVTG